MADEAKGADTPVADMGLGTWAMMAANRFGCATAGELARLDLDKLRRTPGFGAGTVSSIRSCLSRLGLRPAGDPELGLPPGPDTPVKAMGLDGNARKVMAALGCETAGDLAKLAPSHLWETPGCGFATMRHIRERLAAMGLKLAREPAELLRERAVASLARGMNLVRPEEAGAFAERLLSTLLPPMSTLYLRMFVRLLETEVGKLEEVEQVSPGEDHAEAKR